jgi:hypothetical protein
MALNNVELRIRVIEKKPETLDEAFNMACSLEALHNSLVEACKSAIYDYRDKANKRYPRTAGSEHGQRSTESNYMK